MMYIKSSEGDTNIMKEQELTDRSKLTIPELIVLVISAAVTITIVSTCSPLYPLNPWNDANCFFTLGRGITHGLVPYRDLYEQKGPLLYFIYALAALISDKSFTGAWLIECIAASLFAVFSWKTVKLFVDPPKFTIALMPLLLGITYTLKMFNYGGNAEELCFPLLTVAFYFGLRSIINGDGIPSKREAIFCGLITAALFWIKYTFIGFMGGFCFYIIVITVKRKDFAKLWSMIWRFILGFVILTVPVLLYFAATGSLKYLWEAYFYNVVAYHTPVSDISGPAYMPVIKYIYNPLRGIFLTARKYPVFGIMMMLSLIALFFTDKKIHKKVSFFFVITYVFTIGIVFMRPLVVYYYAYITAYCFCLALIPMVKGLEKLSKAFKESPVFMKSLVCLLLTACYVVALLQNKNMYLIFKEKDYLAQYRFAEVINQTPDAKILTYDIMDSGFYTAAGLLPQNRYYCYLTMEKDFPDILEEQNRLIKEGFFDYIVTTDRFESSWENYELIREEYDLHVDYFGNKSPTGYCLYKLKK
jgi:hypothetical protein